MEIRQLRYAVLLDEHRRFARAAQEAFVTQSAFSQQIARLERELGVRLFDRTPAGTVTTPAGERFVEHARRMLTGLVSLESEVRSIGGGGARVLRGEEALRALPALVRPPLRFMGVDEVLRLEV